MAAESPKRTQTSPLGELFYFGIWGRGESIRLTLAAAGATWTERRVDFAAHKKLAGTEELPFGQWPVWTYKTAAGATKHLAQTDAILRLVGRQTGMYGKDADEDARIDEVLGGVESLRQKYAAFIYADKYDEETRKAYATSHVDPSTIVGRNGGAHLGLLNNVVKRNGVTVGGKTTWAAGTSHPTIADAQVTDIVELHARVFGEPTIKSSYPELVSVHDAFKALPGVAAYVADPARRHAKPNNVERG